MSQLNLKQENRHYMLLKSQNIQTRKTPPDIRHIHNRGDKEKLMAAKRNLPAGIFVNHEYPSHIQRARDKLGPI